MRRTLHVAAAVVLVCGLMSCAKKTTPASGPHATVLMRDGTSYTGAVVNSSPSEITLTGDDNASHTLAMKDVRSIDYGDAAPGTPPAQTAPPAQAAAPASPPPEQAAAPAPAPVPPDAYHENHYHPEESAIRTRTWELPAGTQIPIRCEETIDSARAGDGQTFAAEVARDVMDANGDVALPRGANAQLVVVSASGGGRIRGASDLVIDLDSVSVQGRRYRLAAAAIREHGKAGLGENRRTAEYTGGGAVVGTIIGALAGHGRGAAIGALSGAGAGAATQLATRGRSIRVPVESVLTFRLERTLHVEAR